ncbi:MAG: MlaD family protein [Kiloniellaceae bacterium]
METRANYLMVGAFVLALAAGLVVFVLWLAKFQFDVQFTRYDIHFGGSVTGLKVGSPVRYRGVRVGEVIDVSLDPELPEQVQVTIEIDAKTPVRSDTIATLEIEGLTGGLYVLLSGTTTEAPPLAIQPGERRAVIASRRSSLQQVLAGAPELIQKVDLLLVRANDLLNAENRAAFGDILGNVRGFTGALAGQRKEVGTLIHDASAAMANLRGATAALEEMAVTLKADGARLADRVDATLSAMNVMATGIDRSVGDTAADVRSLIADLRDTAKNFSAMSRELEEMIAENREPVRDFTSTALSELTVLLIEMQDLVVALNRVTTEIERDPARFFFGNRQQGYEAR